MTSVTFLGLHITDPARRTNDLERKSRAKGAKWIRARQVAGARPTTDRIAGTPRSSCACPENLWPDRGLESLCGEHFAGP